MSGIIASFPVGWVRMSMLFMQHKVPVICTHPSLECWTYLNKPLIRMSCGVTFSVLQH